MYSTLELGKIGLVHEIKIGRMFCDSNSKMTTSLFQILVTRTALCNIPWYQASPVLCFRYLLLELHFVTFLDIRHHPFHLKDVLHSHIPVCGLIQFIAEQTGIQSTKMSIFTDPSRTREAMLPPELTLKELGYEGGSVAEPDELMLFYDYKVEFTDCPILTCDYYFGEENTIDGHRYRPEDPKIKKLAMKMQ